MKQQFDEALCQVAEKIFESLTFMFSMPEDTESQASDHSAVSARISFEGPFSGVLTLSVFEYMLPPLASNMLGLEEDLFPSIEQQHDALKELVNVICGNLLPRIAGPDAIFNVHVPEFLSDEQPDGVEPTATAHLTLDEGKAGLRLFIDDQPETDGENSDQ